MIQVRNLSKTYNKQTILQGINFQVSRGEIVTLIGPSGSGKSTLMRCLSRLEEPSSGEIHVQGSIGMVFQNFNLFPHMTVLQNLTYAPVCQKRLKTAEAVEKATALLKQAGLGHRSSAYPKTLSGGEKQRVAIMRTLMMDPQFILFDEPTSALDPKMTEEMVKVIRNLASQGIAIMIVTHEMALVRQVSHRVFMLRDGQLSESVRSVADEVPVSVAVAALVH